jgi:hypothetical protein
MPLGNNKKICILGNWKDLEENYWRPPVVGCGLAPHSLYVRSFDSRLAMLRSGKAFKRWGSLGCG